MANIGGSKYFLYAAWIVWKKLQSFVRSHLSHIFALVLGAMVLLRERQELATIVLDVHLNLVRVVLILATLGAVLVMLWRIREYTLSTSLREVRFVEGLGILLLILSGLVFLGEHRQVFATLFGSKLSALQVFMLLMALVTVTLVIIEFRRAWLKEERREAVFARVANVFVVGYCLVAVLHYRSQVSLMVLESHITLGRALIMGLTIATILAALWEISGNKLSTSPQELRFVAAMRLLLFELEKFMWGKDRVQDLDVRLDQFLEAFLRITCNTLCGKKRVHAGLMLELKDSNVVRLFKSTEGSRYPQELAIPIPSPGSVQETGPAGVSYDRLRIVYMPVKRWKLGWPFELIRDEKGERYEPSDASYGWIPAPEPGMEQFRSVLCLPVAVYDDRNTRRAFGVLNFSTSSFDPFVDRDFIMGECFASILAQAFAVARSEATETGDKTI
jgi:hypothetical protein